MIYAEKGHDQIYILQFLPLEREKAGNRHDQQQTRQETIGKIMND